MYRFNEFQPIKTTQYGTTKIAPDVVIWCPHSSKAVEFLNLFPEVIKACVAPLSLLQQFFELERDFGSGTLAHLTAQHLLKLNSKLDIVVACSRIPRGIVDVGRERRRALRNIFKDNAQIEISPASKERPAVTIQQVHNLLYTMHSNSLHEIMSILDTLDAEKGLFIDLHTMAPFSPDEPAMTTTEALFEYPDKLSDYIDDYNKADKRGEKRVIDLITATAQGEQFADTTLMHALAEEFTRAELEFAFNKPYTTDEHLISKKMMEYRRGISIDFPKLMFSTQTVEASNFDLTALTIERKKIIPVAKTIATALKKVIEV